MDLRQGFLGMQVCRPEHIADMYTSAWPHIVDMREVLRRVAETMWP